MKIYQDLSEMDIRHSCPLIISYDSANSEKLCWLLRFWKPLPLIIYVEGHEKCLSSLCFCFPI